MSASPKTPRKKELRQERDRLRDIKEAQKEAPSKRLEEGEEMRGGMEGPSARLGVRKGEYAQEREKASPEKLAMPKEEKTFRRWSEGGKMVGKQEMKPEKQWKEEGEGKWSESWKREKLSDKDIVTIDDKEARQLQSLESKLHGGVLTLPVTPSGSIGAKAQAKKEPLTLEEINRRIAELEAFQEQRYTGIAPSESKKYTERGGKSGMPRTVEEVERRIANLEREQRDYEAKVKRREAKKLERRQKEGWKGEMEKPEGRSESQRQFPPVFFEHEQEPGQKREEPQQRKQLLEELSRAWKEEQRQDVLQPEQRAQRQPEQEVKKEQPQEGKSEMRQEQREDWKGQKQIQEGEKKEMKEGEQELEQEEENSKFREETVNLREGIPTSQVKWYGSREADQGTKQQQPEQRHAEEQTSWNPEAEPSEGSWKPEQQTGTWEQGHDTWSGKQQIQQQQGTWDPLQGRRLREHEEPWMPGQPQAGMWRAEPESVQQHMHEVPSEVRKLPKEQKQPGFLKDKLEPREGEEKDEEQEGRGTTLKGDQGFQGSQQGREEEWGLERQEIRGAKSGREQGRGREDEIGQEGAWGQKVYPVMREEEEETMELGKKGSEFRTSELPAENWEGGTVGLSSGGGMMSTATYLETEPFELESDVNVKKQQRAFRQQHEVEESPEHERGLGQAFMPTHGRVEGEASSMATVGKPTEEQISHIRRDEEEAKGEEVKETLGKHKREEESPMIGREERERSEVTDDLRLRQQGGQKLGKTESGVHEYSGLRDRNFEEVKEEIAREESDEGEGEEYEEGEEWEEQDSHEQQDEQELNTGGQQTRSHPARLKLHRIKKHFQKKEPGEEEGTEQSGGKTKLRRRRKSLKKSAHEEKHGGEMNKEEHQEEGKELGGPPESFLGLPGLRGEQGIFPQ